MSDTTELGFTHGGHVARLWLNRPQVHNALSRDLADSLTAALEDLGGRPEVRVVVLGGRGRSFCAGADLADMKASSEASHEDNRAEAMRLSRLFVAVAESPRPVVARVHGNVFGGGVGLVAASDIAIGTRDAVFAISEVRLGIIPGIISPYLLRRMGDGRARSLMLTGERFDGARAAELSLLQRAVVTEELDATVDAVLAELLRAGPRAQARVKEVLRLNAELPFGEVAGRMPERLAEVRSGEEAKEGFRAFFEKRRPSWAPALEEIEGQGR